MKAVQRFITITGKIRVGVRSEEACEWKPQWERPAERALNACVNDT